MTLKPTIEANKAVNSVLTSSEWNVDMLQLANYVLEVLAGLNTDKIPGTALNSSLAIPGDVHFSTGITPPAASPAIYNNTDGYTHFDNPSGQTGWRWVYNGAVMGELSYLGVLKLGGYVAHRVTGGVATGLVVPTNGSVAFTVTLDDAITPTRYVATVHDSSGNVSVLCAKVTSVGSGTVTGLISSNGTGATVDVHVICYA